MPQASSCHEIMSLPRADWPWCDPILYGLSYKALGIEMCTLYLLGPQCVHGVGPHIIERKLNMTTKNYRKKNVQPMRPYVPGEDMTGISVNKEDTPELGGMIAVNPNNPEDRWYVAKQFFEDNYEEAV